jgi:hypothetical protein
MGNDDDPRAKVYEGDELKGLLERALRRDERNGDSKAKPPVQNRNATSASGTLQAASLCDSPCV